MGSIFPTAAVAGRGVKWLFRGGRFVVGGAAAVLTVVVGLGVLAGPLVLPYQVLHVRSDSMGPELPFGSVVVATEVPMDEVAVGDVITFTHPERGDRTITHRVVGREDGGLVTKGDAAAAPDPWLLDAREAATAWRVGWSAAGYGHVLRVLETPGLGLVLMAWALLAPAARRLRSVFWLAKPAPRSVICRPEPAVG